jgi:hypothetical protein
MLSHLSKILGSKDEKSSQDDAALKQRLLTPKNTPPRYSPTEEILARYSSEEQVIADFSMMLANFSLRGGSWEAVRTAKRIMDARLKAPDYKRQVDEKREEEKRKIEEEKRENKLRMP